MDGKNLTKHTENAIIAASLLLNCILGGASYTYYHHLAEQMNETASLQSQVNHLEGSGLRPAGAGGRIPAGH